MGYKALFSSSTSSFNTAVGAEALFFNTTGTGNTGIGGAVLHANTTGSENTAEGGSALTNNTTGIGNTATGVRALLSNTTANFNTAVGDNALRFNTTGASNIALGKDAGLNLTTGSNNIDIGSPGVAGEGNAIRIGTAGTHASAFIAGVRGVTTGVADGIAVLIDSNGQLGTVSSSRRFKDDIADMDAASSELMRFRPVTFHYKTDQDPAGRRLQYGLIAEEVAAVDPGLVARSADGQVETVLYQFLPPMLLNEYQKQQRRIEAQAIRIADLEHQAVEIVALRQQLATLTDRLNSLEPVQRAVRVSSSAGSSR